MSGAAAPLEPTEPRAIQSRTPVFAARGVHKSFREGREEIELLQGIDFALLPGEIVALEGPSGSGKTTLLSILGCILTPSAGTIAVDGEEIDPLDGRSVEARLPSIRRRSIGFVFQQYNLFPALSALENVEYSLNVRGNRGREAHDEAKRALHRVGLADRAGFLPRDLSGGQKQRVAIARAIAGRPLVLLVTDKGVVKCWGENGAGQLGDGTMTNSRSPVDLVEFGNVVKAISAGFMHTCAVTNNGGVKCLGANNVGQLGDEKTITSSVPVDVIGLDSGVAVISAGGYHTCALTTSGGVKCWGWNGKGQLGDGTTTDSKTPVDVVELENGVIAIDAGGYQTCALTEQG